MAISLPLISFIGYLLLNYWVFVVPISYFLIIGKIIKRDSSNNMIWFYSIYSTFSYAVFAYSMNATILFFYWRRHLYPIYVSDKYDDITHFFNDM